MKLLIVGSLIKDNSLENSYRRAIIENGVSVEVFEIQKELSKTLPFHLDLINKFSFFQKTINFDFIYSKLIDKIRNEDFSAVIIFKCWYIPTKVLIKIKSNVKFLLNYCPDHPRGSKNLISSISKDKVSLYDYILSFSDSLKPVWFQLGAKNYHNIPFGADSKYRIKPNINIKLGWVYFGAWGPVIEEILLGLKKHDITIFGSGWKNASNKMIRSFNINPKYYASKSMYELVNIAFGVLNFTRLEHSCLHSMKTFEIPNSGGFYISNYSVEQNYFYANKKSALYFDNYRDINSLINSCNTGKINVNKLKENAFNISNKYLYKNRVKNLLNIIK